MDQFLINQIIFNKNSDKLIPKQWKIKLNKDKQDLKSYGMILKIIIQQLGKKL